MKRPMQVHRKFIPRRDRTKSTRWLGARVNVSRFWHPNGAGRISRSEKAKKKRKKNRADRSFKFERNQTRQRFLFGQKHFDSIAYNNSENRRENVCRELKKSATREKRRAKKTCY